MSSAILAMRSGGETVMPGRSADRRARSCESGVPVLMLVFLVKEGAAVEEDDDSLFESIEELGISFKAIASLLVPR